MVYCCVPHCFSRSDRNGKIDVDGSKITFHTFPKKLQIRTAWIFAVKRQGAKPNVLWSPGNKAYVVCSRHFKPTDFKCGLKNKCLLPSAIPSIFNKEDHRAGLKKSAHSKTLHSGYIFKESVIPSQNLPVLPAEEVHQIIPPLDPKLVQAWSCSEIENNSKPLIATDNEMDNLPLFMKQALIEKEKIDLTYEGTSAANISNLIRNGNLQSDQSQLDINNIVKIEPESSKEDYVGSSNSTCEILDPIFQNVVNTNPTHIFSTNLPLLVPQNTTNCSHILSNGLCTVKKVKMYDAATSTTFPDLRKKLEERNKLIIGYRKKIKNLLTKNRRCRSHIMKMKHSVFCELKNRNYLSNKSDFNIEKQGCLLDRHSVQLCQSSDTEESEED